MYTTQRLGELLLDRDKVTQKDIDRALKVQKDRGGRIGEILVDMEVVTEADVAEALAEQLDYDFLGELNADQVDLTLLADLKLGYARKARVLPLRREGRMVIVATDDPLNVDAIDEVRFLVRAEVEPVVVPRGVLVDTINRAFDLASQQLGGEIDLERTETAQDDEEGFDISNDLIDASADDEAPIIRFVNGLFKRSVRERASDIHIEPGDKDIVVRFRIDGVLKEVARPPKRFHPGIVTRVKIQAKLNIAEKRIPQDGRIRITMAGKDVDLRVATAPTVHGERITMRLLDKSAMMLNVRDIGFAPDQLQTILKIINRPYGIILVTGPTGSGKTTTLYSCLSEINSPDKNILTVEDPVEYQLDGISQMQVNAKIGLSFAMGLRSYLRHDPDVIMVGEIRDKETAEMAIQASLTGHLVFSTLHTNDAAGAFSRLIDLGIEPFLVASSVAMTMAQRLVRCLCNDCKMPYRPTAAEAAEIGLSLEDVDLRAPDGVIFRPNPDGCAECNGLGYRKRMGIYELLHVNDEMQRLIMNRASAGAVKQEATKRGMRSLRDDGAFKVLQGKTSISEVLRVTAESAADLEEETSLEHSSITETAEYSSWRPE